MTTDAGRLGRWHGLLMVPLIWGLRACWASGAADRAFAGVSQERIKSACQAVFDQIETRFHKEKHRDPVAAWEVPKAAFGAAMLCGGALQVAWAADCPILWMRGDSVRWCTGDPDTSAEVADARALGAGVGAAPALTGAVLEDRRVSRGKAGHKALSPFAAASAAITHYAEVPIAPGDELLLMSDGFASLVTDYGAYTAQGLAHAVRAKGLGALAQEVRSIEHADAACLQFPRFKVSDAPADA